MFFVNQSREQLASINQGNREEEELQAVGMIVELHNSKIAAPRERRGWGLSARQLERAHRFDKESRMPNGNDFDRTFSHAVDDAIVND